MSTLYLPHALSLMLLVLKFVQQHYQKSYRCCIAAGVHNVDGLQAVTGVGDAATANAVYVAADAVDADIVDMAAVDVVVITVEMPRCKVSKYDNRIPPTMNHSQII